SATNHSITAVYNGDGIYNTSTSSVVTQTVNKADTATTLVSSNNPSVFGQSVIFAATVSANAPGAGTPTGTVTFKDGTTSLATNTLVAGVARYTNATFSVADHLITAVYNGDTSFNTNASSVLTQTVNQADATSSLTSSTNPSVFGQAVIFTNTVTAVSPGAGTRTGTVQFKVDGTNSGAPVTLSGNSAASDSLSSLSVGPHTITAVYSGDGNFNGSTSANFTQTVSAGRVTAGTGGTNIPADK